MFNVTDGVIKISVRNLVEFIYRSGDIDNRMGGMPDAEAMQAGSRIHRKIQKAMGSGYNAEVLLKVEVPDECYPIIIEGRADGIFEDDDGITVVDEIKGMYSDVLKFTEPIFVHVAQAKCYGYIYGMQKKLSQVKVQMTYVNLDTEEVQRFVETFTMEQLENWFNDTVNELMKWTRFMYEWEQKRNLSIKKVEFPFEYREGQKELAVSVYKTINRKKVLFIQAPTGVGKTISTVFPAVKAIGEGVGNKLFYLTAKTITRTVAENTFDELRKQEFDFKTITITAKEKACTQEMKCNPVDCPYAKGHFDRVNDAVFDIINCENRIDRNTIAEYAKKHMVCPFEFSLDISYWCDGIICDYNYVFDPNAYLRRYFGDGNKGNYIFLIDEAHNLVERGREMYSATITKNQVMEFKRTMKIFSRKLYNGAERVNKAMLEIKRQVTEDYLVLDSVGSIVLGLMGIYEEILKFNEEHKNFEFKEELMNFFFTIRDFICISELADDKYVIYAMLDDSGDLVLKQFCVDPSTNLNLCIGKGISTIFFSATLLPIMYYKNLLRGSGDDYAIYAHSPFDPGMRKVLMARDINTKYTERTARQYEKVYQYICKTVNIRNGNYMVFFPSYGYMEKVAGLYNENDFEMIKQDSEMNEEDKEEFLKAFETIHQEKFFVGFCVMGGIFSEGIDLKEESLIGAIVVGTGLPQVGVERKILMDTFSENGCGFEYAYVYPGLNKVLQSAGRVIRTEKDKGVIVLLDNRFLQGGYDGLLPVEWSNMDVVDVGNVEMYLKDFWLGE